MCDLCEGGESELCEGVTFVRVVKVRYVGDFCEYCECEMCECDFCDCGEGRHVRV